MPEDQPITPEHQHAWSDWTDCGPHQEQRTCACGGVGSIQTCPK